MDALEHYRATLEGLVGEPDSIDDGRDDLDVPGEIATDEVASDAVAPEIEAEVA